MYKNNIQKIAIGIMIIGVVSAFIIGGATQYADPNYLASCTKYPELYHVEDAPHIYNWFNCFVTLATSLLSGFLFYCLGTIVKNQSAILKRFETLSKENNKFNLEKAQIQNHAAEVEK